ncbi:MAG: phosphate signaling complex protein PhoU [Pseudolabrys sp.]|nr:phosphate signaling complex protein PhoU [Pseudolabrys sp.]
MAMPEHTVKEFDADLADLAQMIAKMGDITARQVLDALDSLEEFDTAKAENVISIDATVDELQHDIEKKVILTIARRQPMAVDLRDLIGALRISNDLERIGDLAKNIGKRVVALKAETPRSQLMRGVQNMGEVALTQLRDVLDAYANRDVAKAVAVWKRDEKLDAATNSLLREMLSYMMEDPRNITLYIHLIFCAKNIERIGDHSTNIAENVHFIVEGRLLSDPRPKSDTTEIGTG